MRRIELMELEFHPGILLLPGNDGDRTIAPARQTFRQAVQPHPEPQQLGAADLADGFQRPRKLFLPRRLPDFVFTPFDTTRFAFEQMTPGIGRFRLRQE